MDSWIKRQPRKKALFLFFSVFFLSQGPLSLAQGPPPAKVMVSPVVNDTVQDKVILIGTVESWRASTVAAEASGRVELLEVRRGAKVKKGEILARLGDSNLLLKLEEARAKRNATHARLEKARDHLERSEKLMKEELISVKDHKEAQLTVKEFEESLAANEAETLQMKDELDKKTVRAPFDGVVTRELTEVGQWVERGSGIVHLIDLSIVRILVDLPARYVPNVNVGGEVTVKMDALGNRVFQGKVHALIPEGHKEAHLFPLEIHVKNQGLQIKEGMLARVEFDLGLARRAMMVHKDAVIVRGSQTYLFVVNEGKAKQLFVTTGKAKEELIEIHGPLKEGERVVIRGNERLRDGQPVEVVPLSTPG